MLHIRCCYFTLAGEIAQFNGLDFIYDLLHTISAAYYIYHARRQTKFCKDITQECTLGVFVYPCHSRGRVGDWKLVSPAVLANQTLQELT